MFLHDQQPLVVLQPLEDLINMQDFFKKFWPEVGSSVVREVKKIFADRKVPEILNRTHITWIPKIQGPETSGNYKPISLCDTIYKVVIEIIVARLRPYLENLISPLQTSFVQGRKGVDNVILPRRLFIH